MVHSVSHSVMFHHFHNQMHLPAQGSISEKEFKDMLKWLQKNYSLVGASTYKKRFEEGKLSSSDICLSFDDALKCQYDIAIPVLEEFGLDAFFFVYSSVFDSNPDYLEIFRLFRTSEFKNIDDFYFYFFKIVEHLDTGQYKKHHSIYKRKNYLSGYSFYSDNDKWFRYLRDQYLGPEKYKEIMKTMILNKGFDIKKAMKDLWMTEDDLRNINKLGHIIGLHSYSHPTQMSKLSREDQEREYSKNKDHLSQITGIPIKVMSHPCGDYNIDTLQILEKMGITMGFRSNMLVNEINSSLEIPREDHANVFKEMKS